MDGGDDAIEHDHRVRANHVIGAGDRGAELDQRQGDHQRWDQCGSAPKRPRVVAEQVDDFGVHLAAVLDGVDAGTQGGLDTCQAFGVGGNEDACVVRLLADRRHFFLTHLRSPRLADRARIGDPARGRDLDDVDAMAEVDAHVSACIHGLSLTSAIIGGRVRH